MIKNTTLLRKTTLLFFLLFSFGFSSKTFSQCAGEDNTIDLCDKSTQQFVDLFAALGGNPQTGGNWTDNDNSNGLNTTTGVLNTWVISSGGVFTYTYTNSSCGESATVTLNLAGYPGGDNMNAVACDDNTNVNLFQFTGGNPSATVPGRWSLTAVDNDNGDTVASVSGALSGRTFDAAQAGTGSYTFTYTVTDQVAQSCFPPNSDQLSSTVILEVTPAPESGNPDPSVQTSFCESDDLTGQTNFNLRNAIINEDDGGYWEEITTNEISGINDSSINIQNIRDTFGPGEYIFTYIVEPINQICNESRTNVTITIEEVADFTNASLELTFPDDAEDIICEDDLPITPIATLSGDPNLIPDGDYEVTYTVSPAPNSGSETISLTLLNGEGSFNVNPDFFTAAGVAELRIVQIVDPNTDGTCDALIGELTDSLTIVALPDLSDSAISVNEPLCFGENANFSITDAGTTGVIELADGEYSFTYTLATGTSTQEYTQTATVTNGSASIMIMANALPIEGDYTATLTRAENSSGCVTASSLTTNFTVLPVPDPQTVSVSIDDTCQDDVVTVTITDASTPANLTDGTYNFTYDISGSISENALVAEDVELVNGTGSFDLPAGILMNGESTLTLTSLQNSISNCETTITTNPSTTFEIIATPDLSASTLEVEDICENESAIALINADPSAVADGNYNLTYSISGANTAEETTITVTFTNGDASFNLAGNLFGEAGTTTLEITALTTENQECPAAGLPASTDFEVNPLPSLENSTLTADSSCEGEAVTVNINNPNIVDGSYDVVYQVTGANALTDQTETLEFVSGQANFSIAAANLTNTGTNTLSITEITDTSTPNACTVTVTALTTTFSINPEPNFSQITISELATTCLGSDVSLLITDTTGTLLDGIYEVMFDLSGQNMEANQTATLNFASGSGTLVVDAALVPNPGETSIQINSLTDASTACSSSNTPVSESFTIAAPPDLTAATLSINDTCLNDSPVTATLSAPALSDGSYSLNYTTTGASTGSGMANNVAVVNGEATFNIDPALLTNTGTLAISIVQVTNETSSCVASGLAISTDFAINPLPVVESADLSVDDICLEENATVTIAGTDLADGDYDIVYTLSNANTASVTERITFTGGEATISLDATTLTASGTTNFSITQVTDVNTSCVSNNVATTDFLVNPIPEVAAEQLSAFDICLNENGLISFTDATGLADGDYTVFYDLSGANENTNVEATLNITSGSGSFEIPASLLGDTGVTTFTLRLVSSAAGCDSDPLVISDDFEVLPLPDAVGLTVSIADVCFGEPVEVSLSGATLLADADYEVTYQLSGANTSDEITETLTFAAGTAVFAPDSSLFANSGSTTINILDVQHVITLCSAANLGNPAGSFVIEDPQVPALGANGEVFCINDSPTVADLEARISTSFTVVTYNSATGGAPLSATTLLLDNTSYYLSVINDQTGCESSVRLEVTIDLGGCDSVFIPTGFSPNGDGMNDVFEIKNIDIIYPDYTIEIFNRNGSVVFKGNTAVGFWDGNANTNNLGGNILPNGVYFYIINFNDGQTGPKQGNVYLNR